MKFSKKDVKQLSTLANLPLTEDEMALLEKDLSAILGYIEHIQKAETSKANALAYVQDIKNVSRKDEVHSFESRDEMLATIPNRDGDFVKAKATLKHK